MRILVCGGRDYVDESKVFLILNEYKNRITVLIHGAARGADLIAKEWAVINRIPDIPFYAHWDRYGKSAGPRRNKQMLVDGHPDLVIAFPGGPGTSNMITQAEKAQISIRRIEE